MAEQVESWERSSGCASLHTGPQWKGHHGEGAGGPTAVLGYVCCIQSAKRKNVLVLENNTLRSISEVK